MGTSYSMGSLGISTPMDPMSGYGQFEPKTMMQRDEDEGVDLFPEQPYGMGQIEHTYPSEHYLNNYWRLFHPTFPVVHRSTFASMSPMLRAAMIAIGGQYSHDTTVKHKSRKLHDRCIKLLEKVSSILAQLWYQLTQCSAIENIWLSRTAYVTIKRCSSSRYCPSTVRVALQNNCRLGSGPCITR
jgi:hypothetical protein